MADSDRLSGLIAESHTLDRARDQARLREIYSEAAMLVDRHAQPKKWAALRSMYAQLTEDADPAGAMCAYRDALTVWDQNEDHDSWASCHLNLGWMIARQGQAGTAEAEDAISHLELVVSDFPFVAGTLALLYRFRALGDPLENWRQEVKYFELALSQVSRDTDPAGWASLMNELAHCWTSEPNADFNLVMPKRIEYHQAALEAVAAKAAAEPDSPAHKTWIDTCIDLSEAYEFSVGGDPIDKQLKAEAYARQVLDACTDAISPEVRARALLGLGRALVQSQFPDPTARLKEALALFDQAAPLIDAASLPVMSANVDNFRASTYFEAHPSR